jgi:hypothetical protein
MTWALAFSNLHQFISYHTTASGHPSLPLRTRNSPSPPMLTSCHTYERCSRSCSYVSWAIGWNNWSGSFRCGDRFNIFVCVVAGPCPLRTGNPCLISVDLEIMVRDGNLHAHFGSHSSLLHRPSQLLHNTFHTNEQSYTSAP